ncbi:2-hydroxyacid dehydrogenase [Sphingobium sp. PNB]|uniref:2-hydroxyacid dehydrogenase n=1 Tax=Sphingobium sp. PNB TaxID=863934 RepID=UPI001CA43B00|nr:2-hydroxyacid dehydrogenase [Sphingobium sp. PNB]
MRVAVFSTKPYDRQFLEVGNAAAGFPHDLAFLEARLSVETAPLAAGSGAVCAFVNDCLDRLVLERLAVLGIKLVVLRSAGFNNVDLLAADALKLPVARVPAYSPQAIAEHTLALILSLDRKIHKAYARVREGNFSLEGLLGFDLNGRTVGIVGTGKIGAVVARILNGFGCHILACDPTANAEIVAMGGIYVELDALLAASDIITLHCPLLPETRHIIDSRAVARMKRGVMLINTSRGGVIDTQAMIDGLKTGVIGYLGLDVYEEEDGLFFENLSQDVIQDDIFARLLTFPNVLVTGHQGFFTGEALTAIAAATIENLSSFEGTGVAAHQIAPVRS